VYAGMAIQDRTFNADGSLFYNAQLEDAFKGDKVVVNGKVWPYLMVDQGKYRFRLLNGLQSLDYSLRLENITDPGNDPSFTLVGTDLGLISAPIDLGNDIGVQALAERMDAPGGNPTGEAHWDDLSEFPILGNREVWEFENPTNSMHPMHVHLVRFQILSKTDLITDGDGLVDGNSGVVLIADYPQGVDIDTDGYAEGEQTLGTSATLADSDLDLLNDGLEVANGANPLDPASWQNLADGDVASYGVPNGQINAGDLTVAIRLALGLEASRALELELAHGDLGTPDGIINAADVILLIQMIQSP